MMIFQSKITFLRNNKFWKDYWFLFQIFCRTVEFFEPQERNTPLTGGGSKSKADDQGNKGPSINDVINFFQIFLALLLLPALCIEIGFMRSFQGKQNATVKIKSEILLSSFGISELPIQKIPNYQNTKNYFRLYFLYWV